MKKHLRAIWNSGALYFAIPIIAAAGFVMLLFSMSNIRNMPARVDRVIESELLHITISGDTQRRDISITRRDTGQTMTLRATSRQVVRRGNTPPPIPQRTVRHDSDFMEIYTVGNLVIIFERLSGQRHYI